MAGHLLRLEIGLHAADDQVVFIPETDFLYLYQEPRFANVQAVQAYLAEIAPLEAKYPEQVKECAPAAKPAASPIAKQTPAAPTAVAKAAPAASAPAAKAPPAANAPAAKASSAPPAANATPAAKAAPPPNSLLAKFQLNAKGQPGGQGRECSMFHLGISLSLSP